jgi:hypothetical protein
MSSRLIDCFLIVLSAQEQCEEDILNCVREKESKLAELDRKIENLTRKRDAEKEKAYEEYRKAIEVLRTHLI